MYGQTGVKQLLTTLLSREAVDRVISLAVGADLSSEGDGGAAGLEGNSVGVNVGDRDLDRGVVLGVDEAASGRALAGDVKVDEDTLKERTENRRRSATWKREGGEPGTGQGILVRKGASKKQEEEAAA